MKASKVIVLLFINLLIVGCGANKVATSSNSSTNTGGIGPKLYADCNGFQKSGTQGVVSAFVSGGSYVKDLINLKFTQINANVTTSNHFIQIFRWTESNGTRQYNQTPVYIVAVLKSTNAYLNNGAAAWDRINKTNIENVINAHNLGAQGINASNFMNHVYFVLAGMDIQYQAMAIAFFDSGASNASYDYIDVLLPSFDANPNSYAASKAANSALPSLHPNWTARSNGMTNQQYKDATAVYCSQF